MMRHFFTIALLCCATVSWAQQTAKQDSSFDLGTGLHFSFNDGAYQFGIGGMMQPYVSRSVDSAGTVSHQLSAKRAYLSIHGSSDNERIQFLFQTDLASPSVLLDAWIAYQPCKKFTVYFGQKQNIANNREMLVMEDQLQFADRSMLSTTFSQSGRELGVFAEKEFGIGGVMIKPQIAITSGDGRNSFGADSRDVDLGGFKYSARLDLFPFGNFTGDNDECIADLYQETKPKMVVGAAASMNDGASNATGEGHGDFTLYNANSDFQRPDYRQLYFDLLMKYRGFSILGEYQVSTATGLTGAFLNESATVALVPTQISEFLALGRAYNVQLGYVSTSNWGIDMRYSGVVPEFDQNKNSIVQETTAWQCGITRYTKKNNLKMTMSYGQMVELGENDSGLLEFMAQVRF